MRWITIGIDSDLLQRRLCFRCQIGADDLFLSTSILVCSKQWLKGWHEECCRALGQLDKYSSAPSLSRWLLEGIFLFTLLGVHCCSHGWSIQVSPAPFPFQPNSGSTWNQPRKRHCPGVSSCDAERPQLCQLRRFEFAQVLTHQSLCGLVICIFPQIVYWYDWYPSSHILWFHQPVFRLSWYCCCHKD